MPIPAHVTPRLRIDKAKARTADPDLNATDIELDTALATLNQDLLYDEQRALWTTQVWDRTTPINGVPAQHFLDRDDVPLTGDVYLLLRAGQVVGFQPHNPDTSGIVPIPKGQGKTRGEKHADVMAADAAATEIVRRVREHIVAGRGKSA